MPMLLESIGKLYPFFRKYSHANMMILNAVGEENEGILRSSLESSELMRKAKGKMAQDRRQSSHI